MTITNKTKFKKQNQKKNFLESIPRELVIEIVARVGASSSKDLFHTKRSCKTLNEVADDKCITQRVSLDKIDVIPWTSNQQSNIFLDRCTNSGNPEALYRRGMVQYFGKMEMMISGIDCLMKAADSGHLEAMYAIGIILILHGSEGRDKGIKIISDIMKNLEVTRERFKKIRDIFLGTIRSMWVKNSMVVEQIRPTCCTRHQHANVVKGWNEDVDFECEACCCDQEIRHLWKTLPKSV